MCLGGATRAGDHSQDSKYPSTALLQLGIYLPGPREMTDTQLWDQWPVRLKRCREGAMLYNINDEYIGRSLDTYGEISRAEVELYRQIVHPSMTAVEVGANIGVHTIPLARLVGADGRVMAFEPQRIVFQMLCANIALNALPNVVTYQAAVGRDAGSVIVPPVD